MRGSANAGKTRDELVAELHELRRRLAELEQRQPTANASSPLPHQRTAPPQPAQDAFPAPHQSDETSLALVLEAAQIGTWDWDIAANQLRLSPRCCALFGLPTQTLLPYAQFLEAVHPDDRQRIEQAVCRAIEGREDFDVEMRTVWPDASQHAVAMRGGLRRDASARAVRMCGVARDATARRQAAEALRASEARFRSLFEHTPDAVFLTIPEGRIAAANPAACAMFGMSEQEICQAGKAGLIDPNDHRHALAWEERKRTGRSSMGEMFYIRKSGERFPAEFSSVIVPGSEPQAFVTLRDISQRTQAEEQLRLAKTTAEAASRAKDQFLAVLSHELRTPLTPILAAASLLETDQRLDEELRQDMQIIRRNAELEARLIDDLLDLNRISRGKLELRHEVADVHALLEHAIWICGQSPTQGKQLRVQLHAAASEHRVWGDPARLEQVFWNLVSNATKFTPTGGRIDIRTSNPQPGQVQVEVRDTGMGIDPQDLQRIFQTFEQGGRTVTRQFGGLGLGLAICKNIVELHHGTICAHSPGRKQGASFIVTLSALDPAFCPPAPAPAEPAPTPSGKTRLRILLVEDHPDTARIMKQLLQAENHHVQVAQDMASALRLASRQTFDLVVSDLGLPDGSGHELMRKLKSAGLPLQGIAVSGYGQEEDIARSQAAGFCEHLTKPLDLKRLYAAIARVAAQIPSPDQ